MKKNAVPALQFLEILLELCASGLDGAAAIRCMKEQVRTKDIAAEILVQLEGGCSLCNALMAVLAGRRHRGIAQELLYLATAEETGKLEPALDYVCKRIRQRQEFREDVAALLVYPMWVVVMVVVATVLLVVYGIPYYRQLMPGVERVVWRGIGYAGLWLLGTSALGMGAACWMLWRHSVQERLFTSLAYLCDEGISLRHSLVICRETCLSARVRNTLGKMSDALEVGMDLAATAQLYGGLDAFSTTWLSAADKGGRTARAFSKIAEHYRGIRSRNRQLVKRLAEPWATMAAGGCVLFLAIGSALPLLTGIQL